MRVPWSALRVPAQRRLLQLRAAVQPALACTAPLRQPQRLLRPPQHPWPCAAARCYSTTTPATGENDGKPAEAMPEAPDEHADPDAKGEEVLAVQDPEEHANPEAKGKDVVAQAPEEPEAEGEETTAADAGLAGADEVPEPEIEIEAEGPSPVDGETYTGKVVSWIQTSVVNGYGFVHVDEFEGLNFFVPKSAIRDGSVLVVGTKIEFTAVKEIDRKTGDPRILKGKMRWRGAMVTGGADIEFEYSSGIILQKTHTIDIFANQQGPISGKVLVWLSGKGFGFVKPKIGNISVFLHASEITDGNSVEPESIVEFTPKWDQKKKKWFATKLTGGSQEGRPWGVHHNGPEQHFRVFIRGLSWETESRDLREAFAEYGVLDCHIAKTHEAPARSRGFGFVRFSSKEDVDRAVEEMDYALIHDRLIRCSPALPRGQKHNWDAPKPPVSDGTASGPNSSWTRPLLPIEGN